MTLCIDRPRIARFMKCTFAKRQRKRVHRCVKRQGAKANAMAVEALDSLLSRDDVVFACAPWGAVCVTVGTKYIPIAMPSIVASLFLFVPLVYAAKKVVDVEVEARALRRELEETRAKRGDDDEAKREF